ncbi:hypothetical protein [Olivibacter sitiensis]|uniref:hypothetical protein n=1 Tax=Olivibacter sitiensis TaxID=376470 RepID=UPI000416BC20|nr:hypothetical protein [Olivibacter sitiensis]
MPIKKPVITLFSAITALLCLLSFGIDPYIERLKEQLRAYILEHPFINLYLHLDKDIYMAGETVWFKAYLPSTSIIDSEVLFIRLLNERKQIVAEKELPIYDVRSHGEITLPNDLFPGTYTLYAFSDRMINFGTRDIFHREIKVSADPGNMLRVSAHVVDTSALKPGSDVKIRFRAESRGAPAKNVKGNYRLLTTRSEVIQEDKISTNADGNAEIAFKYPPIANTETMRLEAIFNKSNADAEVNLLLPPLQKEISLNVFAGNGDIIVDTPCKLVLETTDQNGSPISTKIALLSRAKIIRSVITDKNGLAAFDFLPREIDGYSFQIQNDLHRKTEKFPLPIKRQGWTMKLKNLENERKAIVYNKGMHEKATLVLRSATDILWDRTINIKNGDSILLTLPEIDSAKQVLGLSLFDHRDSLHIEKLFLSRDKENYHVEISFEKKDFGTGQKVKSYIHIADAAGRPVVCNLSVSVASTRTIDDKIHTNIVQSEEKLISLLYQEPKQLYSRSDSPDDLLLAAQWRLANWQDVLKYEPKGALKLMKNTGGVLGMVKPKRKKTAMPQEMHLFAASGYVAIPIEQNGLFSIHPSYLLAREGQENHLLTDEKFREKYGVTLIEPLDGFDDQVIGILSSDKHLSYMTATAPPERLPLITGVINLKAVEITAKVSGLDSLTYQKLLRQYPRNCADYVCEYNILNCRNHRTGSRPVIGATYTYNGRSHRYTECLTAPPAEDNSIALKNISIPEEFPQADSTTTPEMLSTLYWNPNLNTNKQGDAAFEFFTSALKGDFILIIQGVEIHSLKPLYGRSGFAVR